jgi:hypothetical protein
VVYKKSLTRLVGTAQSGPWSEEELTRLVDLVKIHGRADWFVVAEKLGTGRTDGAVHQRYLKIVRDDALTQAGEGGSASADGGGVDLSGDEGRGGSVRQAEDGQVVTVPPKKKVKREGALDSAASTYTSVNNETPQQIADRLGMEIGRAHV